LSSTIAVGRDTKVMGVVGLAHGFSHFYQLVLPPLFPLMNRAEGYGFADLGFVVIVMYLASAVCQPAAGMLVDRFGARTVLITGLALQASATALIAIIPSYEVLLMLALLVGIGNSVFHPCDYSVMSATITESRLGRAYSVHMLGGYLGYALAPILMAYLGNQTDWRTAILIAGLMGLAGLVVVALASGDFRDSRHERRGQAAAKVTARELMASLFKGPIVLCWLFFAFLAMAQIGIQSKTVSILTLPDSFAIDIETAGVILTTFLLATAIGVMAGGIVAERTHRHDDVVAVGYAAAALAVGVLWLTTPPTPVVFAIYAFMGFIYGLAFPSRDIIVRNTTPRESSGTVFGFVYSGMDFGSLVTPVLFGWLIDAGAARYAFLCVAVLWVISIFVLKASGTAVAKAAASET
jgi:MFS family permease